MAGTITGCTKVGALAWLYTWTGTANFSGYSEGKAVFENSDATSIVMQWTDDTAPHRVEPPVLEVIDSTQTTANVQQVTYPPSVTIQFRGKSTNGYYIVAVDDGTGYVNVATLAEDGSGYYQFNSSALASLDYTFKVTPYDIYGTASDAIAISVFHHTSPEPAILTYVYNAGTGLVTVDLL